MDRRFSSKKSNISIMKEEAAAAAVPPSSAVQIYSVLRSIFRQNFLSAT
jgi:hypothetical protein